MSPRCPFREANYYGSGMRLLMIRRSWTLGFRANRSGMGMSGPLVGQIAIVRGLMDHQRAGNRGMSSGLDQFIVADSSPAKPALSSHLPPRSTREKLTNCCSELSTRIVSFSSASCNERILHSPEALRDCITWGFSKVIAWPVESNCSSLLEAFSNSISHTTFPRRSEKARSNRSDCVSSTSILGHQLDLVSLMILMPQQVISCLLREFGSFPLMTNISCGALPEGSSTMIIRSPQGPSPPHSLEAFLLGCIVEVDLFNDSRLTNVNSRDFPHHRPSSSWKPLELAITSPTLRQSSHHFRLATAEQERRAAAAKEN